MAFTFTASVSCQPSGGFITITALQNAPQGVLQWSVQGVASGIARSGVLGLRPYAIGPLGNDDYTVELYSPAADSYATEQTQTIACGPPAGTLVFDSLTHTDASAGSATGSLTVQVSGGVAPYTILVLPAGLVLPANAGQSVTFPGLPPGVYTVQVSDYTVSLGIPNPQSITGSVTIAAYVPSVIGCMDENALNYNPNATEAGACSFGARWRSAWQPVEVVAVAPLPTAAYLEAELWTGFPVGHPLAGSQPLTLLTTVRATVSPGGLATFRLGPFLQPLLGANDGHGGRRLDLNSPTAYATDLYQGYDLRLPGGGTLLQRGVVLNAAVPDAELGVVDGMLTPFAGRLPVWPGFDDYLVAYLLPQGGQGQFGTVAPSAATSWDSTLLPCPQHPLPVAWLAPGGGFGYWVFAGRPRHGLDQSEGTLFNEALSNERRWSERGQALATVTASSGVFSGADWSEGLRTLRTSPQVWYQPDGDGTPWVPVVLESGSFSVRRRGVNRNEVVVAFSEARPLAVQGQ